VKKPDQLATDPLKSIEKVIEYAATFSVFATQLPVHPFSKTAGRKSCDSNQVCLRPCGKYRQGDDKENWNDIER